MIPKQAYNLEKPAGVPVVPEEAKDIELFQPYQIKSVKFHNKVGVSPMCMYSAEDGIFNDYHKLHYGSLALKGPGLIIIEATGVAPEGRITPGCTGIWSDEHISGLKSVIDIIKSQGTVAGIQIAHAGRKASISPPYDGDYLIDEAHSGWPNNIKGPSELPYSDYYGKPKSITTEEIAEITQAFVDAAIRAEKAGADLLEIHSAHGYLLQSFLSGNSNKRTDQYGGSFENRIRLLLEVTKAVRAVWSEDKPLWVRISCTDWVNPDPMGEDPNGWDIHQSIELAKRLKALGVDTIDCSSGGNITGVKYPSQKLYQVQFADAIKREAGISTAAVGLIQEGEEAEEILKGNKADYVLVGREFLRDSGFVLTAAQDLNVNIQWPKQYGWAVKKSRHDRLAKLAKSKIPFP
ncbi:hypothetical protein BDB01DRAFT_306494 [Pilobolus umbonatus]|nr:hypothetical protein BDB01DRAFT_306494 [Pilobolus umbonatus]